MSEDRSGERSLLFRTLLFMQGVTLVEMEPQDHLG